MPALPEDPASFEPADAAAETRLDRLVDLLENDRLGYRLERFVAAERERLAQALAGGEFKLSGEGEMNPCRWTLTGLL